VLVNMAECNTNVCVDKPVRAEDLVCHLEPEKKKTGAFTKRYQLLHTIQNAASVGQVTLAVCQHRGECSSVPTGRPANSAVL
jgi:hypothetical protein